MIVYNITNKVQPGIEKEWVKWQKEEHIPDVLSSGQFTEHKFYKLLEQEESEGVTYIVQFFAASQEHYDHYINEHASRLRKKTLDKWGNKFIAFRTVMQVVN